MQQENRIQLVKARNLPLIQVLYKYNNLFTNNVNLINKL